MDDIDRHEVLAIAARVTVGLIALNTGALAWHAVHGRYSHALPHLLTLIMVAVQLLLWHRGSDMTVGD